MDRKLLKKLQMKELEIIDEVDRICKKYHIQWYLAYGSVLGAVRHGGFIPWDDDMDIYFLGEDYKRFMEACKMELDQDRFFLQTMETDKNYSNTFGKIRMNNTCSMYAAHRKRKMHWGICIDLFQLHYAPDSAKDRERLKKIYWLYGGICTGQYEHLFAWHGFIGSFKCLMKHCLYALKIHKYLEYKMKKILKNPCKELLWDAEQGDFIESKYFEKPSYWSFEDRVLPCPSEPEKYLEIYYGEWKRMPPESERYGHKGIIVDTEKSYVEYQ